MTSPVSSLLFKNLRRRGARPTRWRLFSTWKGLGLRVGLPILVVWIVAILYAKTWAFIAAAVITAVAAGMILWAVHLRQKDAEPSPAWSKGRTPRRSQRSAGEAR